MSLYTVPVTEISGIGKTRAAFFSKLGINSVGDLLRFYPRTYEDWGASTLINEVQNGEKCVIKATVTSAVTTTRISGGRILSKVIVSDSSGAMELVFFNNQYISSMLKYSQQYYFMGKVTKDNYSFQMVSPQFKNADKASDILPIYNLTAGLNNHTVIKAVRGALEMLPQDMTDPIPQQLLDKYNLCTLRFALMNIHFPSDNASLEKARQRLVFEELLVLNLGLSMLRSNKRKQTSISMPMDYTGEFVDSLPYTLTNAQKNAIADCVNDMKSKKSPMNRLVQGDVGCGKTAVATALCYNACKNGYQSAFMAPTEILAQQHYNNLSRMLEPLGLVVELIVGSMTKSQKDKFKQRLSNGEIDVAVGTHALISDSVEFRNLGLAVTDEQHRFGVEQRSILAKKGSSPHILVLSATPIPRTLGLIIYGDLDITCIDELPLGRQPVKTMLIDSSKRERALGFIKKQLDIGRQCYIVCPLVEESVLELESAENYAAELMLSEFSDYPVGILHGKMKTKEKEAVMNSFLTGDILLLVSTTVIEVGVDVANASVIMIENAERFGLSQLHQLRGRVGRGEHESFCILVSDNHSENTTRRLSTMCRTTDGFEIADEDLKLRGPGDFFGNRQHGLPKLNIADFSDMKGLSMAKDAAQDILIKSPDLSADSYRGLRAMVKLLFLKTGDTSLN